ncbi:MAG: hypothetical protein KGL39_24835 [Patescibacteria group bacterium]|nr:hypothetical protein [Patescibacteria group bacterium]
MSETAAETTTTTPTATPTSTPSPTSTLPPGSIVVDAQQFAQLRSTADQFAQFQRDQQAAMDAKETERLAAVALKEGADKALEQQRTAWEGKLTEAQARAKQIESRMLAANRKTVIAQALSGKVFSGATAEIQASQTKQLQTLLDNEIEASIDGNGDPIVRDKLTGRPADQVLREMLAGPEYAHYFAANGAGGTGGGGGDRSGRQQEAEKPPEPGSFEAIRDGFMAARSNLAKPRGLSPISRQK